MSEEKKSFKIVKNTSLWLFVRWFAFSLSSRPKSYPSQISNKWRLLFSHFNPLLWWIIYQIYCTPLLSKSKRTSLLNMNQHYRSSRAQISRMTSMIMWNSNKLCWACRSILNSQWWLIFLKCSRAFNWNSWSRDAPSVTKWTPPELTACSVGRCSAWEVALKVVKGVWGSQSDLLLFMLISAIGGRALLLLFLRLICLYLTERK